jgi:predicted membrane-bound mannosyltransferase
MIARRMIPCIEALLVGLLTLFALALRLSDLGARALLPDESSSFNFSQLPPSTLLWSLCDPHPPG